MRVLRPLCSRQCIRWVGCCPDCTPPNRCYDCDSLRRAPSCWVSSHIGPHLTKSPQTERGILIKAEPWAAEVPGILVNFPMHLLLAGRLPRAKEPTVTQEKGLHFRNYTSLVSMRPINRGQACQHTVCCNHQVKWSSLLQSQQQNCRVPSPSSQVCKRKQNFHFRVCVACTWLGLSLELQSPDARAR